MDEVRTKPGPDAGRAFHLGSIAAAVAALAGVALLYQSGHLSISEVVFTLVALFPPYLLVVASVLSVWLDLGKDTSDLRPVYRDRERG